MTARVLATPSVPTRATDMRRLRAAMARSTLLRFLVVGGVSYVVNQALLIVLYVGAFASLPRDGGGLAALDLPLLLASMIALEMSIILRFALNDRWTFRDRRTKPLGARFYQSNFTSFGGPLISLATVNVLTPHFGVNYLISNSLGILLGLAWNWFWSTRLVWTTDRVPARGGTGPKRRGQTVDVLPVGQPARTSPHAMLVPYSLPLPGGLDRPPSQRSAD
jgi:putative flippase GtrA